MKCDCSDEIQEIWASMSEFDRGLLCKCGSPLTRVFITAPAIHGAENPEYKNWGNTLEQPLNIFKENPEGGYTVTRIGKKKDVEND
jgi:hypothetical protein